MAEEEKKGGDQSKLQLLLGPIVALLVLLFSQSKVYERAELVTYDWRFNIRNNIFGLLPTDPRLGTIDIDLKSVEVEGRYQDWTRDKYTEVVSILSDYGAKLVGFDVYFIEPSTKLISSDQISELSRIDSASVGSLLDRADYDALFERTIEKADNVYLAQTVVVPHDDLHKEAVLAKMETLTPDQEEALAIIRKRSPKLMVNPEESTIWRGFDFEPPLKLLRDVTRGFAYAQTVHDVDGARRRYPLVYQYKDVVFPSIALLMACDFMRVPIETAEVWPGSHILLPGAQVNAETVRDIEIPIDEFGNMNVNWAGGWAECFVHYPHIALRRAAQRHQQQQLLNRVKAIVASDPGKARNPRAIPGELAKEGFGDRAANRTALVTWFQASGIERAVTRDKELGAEDFWRSKGVADPNADQLRLFQQIQRNNSMVDFLRQDPSLNPERLETLLPGHDRNDLRQSEYFVRSLLSDGLISPDERPLYFYPYKVFQDRMITPSEVDQKILFYGLTAPGTTDLSVTPFEGSYPMVGIYPNVFNTILQEKFIRRVSPWLNAALIVGLGILLSVIVPRLKVLIGAFLILAVVLIYAIATFAAFTHGGMWLEMIGPMMMLVVGYLALTIYGYVIKEQEKEFVQGAFGHYLSPAVVDQIMNNPGMVGQLGGEERVMTAFFSDIASFSTISECLTPGELVAFINEYLSEMCDIVEYYGGTIDKFEGDAIVAFFGAPVVYEDHAVRACLSCIDQQRKLVELRQRWEESETLPVALHQLRERWEKQGRLFAHVRMGLTSGPMIVGNMGSRGRVDYTMMGDTVNLAARFESGQKMYGTAIMVNDVIYEQVSDLVEARKLDLIQVMGKEEPVVAYEILDRKGELSPQKLEVLEIYGSAMKAYEDFDFALAGTRFKEALEVDPTDGPSALYADRCEEYALNPPEDLVFRAQTK